MTEVIDKQGSKELRKYFIKSKGLNKWNESNCSLKLFVPKKW